MYAIVDIAGQQFKVEKEQEIFVHRLQGEEGANVTFDNVMLVENSGKVTVGTPKVEGASISAKILSHMKGDKVIVFKKEKKKRISESQWTQAIYDQDPDRRYSHLILSKNKN